MVVVDNLYNSSEKALERVEKITGRKVKFYEADLLDSRPFKEVFDKEEIDSVIHFAVLRQWENLCASPWNIITTTSQAP